MSIIYDVEEAAELAAQAWLRKANLDWLQPSTSGGADRVYVGLDGRETADEGGQEPTLELPCVVCSCEQAEPILPHYHGNWNALLRIEIRSQSDDTRGKTHGERVRQISELFYTTTIVPDLVAAFPAFFVAKVVPGTRTRTRQDRHWITTLDFTLVSCYAVDSTQ